jgi:hypothetical protein
VEADKLHKGDLLTTSNGSLVTVVGGTTPAVSSGDMWDLTVPGDHDFYVLAGDAPVLVHNCATGPGGPALKGDPYSPEAVAARSQVAKSYMTLLNATIRARGLPVDDYLDAMSDGMTSAVTEEPFRLRMFFGTILEKTFVANDPEVLADPNITHLGGKNQPDFVISSPDGPVNIDITGGSASSIQSHMLRPYYDIVGQLITYPSFDLAEILPAFFDRNS